MASRAGPCRPAATRTTRPAADRSSGRARAARSCAATGGSAEGAESGCNATAAIRTSSHLRHGLERVRGITVPGRRLPRAQHQGYLREQQGAAPLDRPPLPSEEAEDLPGVFPSGRVRIRTKFAGPRNWRDRNTSGPTIRRLWTSLSTKIPACIRGSAVQHGARVLLEVFCSLLAPDSEHGTTFRSPHH